ncbi:MAG: hypothetical protein ACYCT0_07105, partial [Sulfobacillus sp.]
MASGMGWREPGPARLRRRALIVIVLSMLAVIASIGGIQIITRVDKTILYGAEKPLKTVAAVARPRNVDKRTPVDGLPP